MRTLIKNHRYPTILRKKQGVSTKGIHQSEGKTKMGEQASEPVLRIFYTNWYLLKVFVISYCQRFKQWLNIRRIADPHPKRHKLYVATCQLQDN